MHIGLRNNDSTAINEEIDRMSKEKQVQFNNKLSFDTPITKYLRELIDKKVTFGNSAEMLNKMECIVSRHLNDAEMEELYQSDMESEFGVHVNSMYVYAMVFNLLHEYSHHSLKHDLGNRGNVDEENAADHSAFWCMFSDLDSAEHNTAMSGILCSLVSLIFVDTTLKDDGIHPLPVERIFSFYDIVKPDNPKYAGLLLHLFYAWAVYTHNNDMPKLEGPYDETLERIRAYMLELEHRNNGMA
jgi:hypothetical protein